MQQKDDLQTKAFQEWVLNDKKGTLAMCTGSGKSRVGILALDKIKGKACLIVPTEKLRDENWKNEFIKWKKQKEYDTLDRYCYASIAKIKNKEYDLVIADEIHNITENNSKFFENNEIKAIIGLTATPPETEEKIKLLDKYAPVCFTYSLSQGVKDKVVSPYDIRVIETRLDNKEKTIRSGNKTKGYYYVTERKKYENLTKLINSLRYKGVKDVWAVLNRMRFIYNLESKTKIAKFVLENMIDPKERTLIFCGSIEQAEKLCPYTYHSKSDDKHLKLFINKKINRLSCVKALNEGHNIPDVDSALIVQVNSKEKDLVQRVNKPAPCCSNAA